MSNKNYMIISLYSEKALDKIQPAFFMVRSEEIRDTRDIPKYKLILKHNLKAHIKRNVQKMQDTTKRTHL